jgi:threonine synthase|tara:strand:- start:30 stop:1358 length:1329 start_codon:yes stop_codon:yes gene_type:complete
VVHYQSTRGHKETLSFQDVILSGVAPDIGLYLPDSITIEKLAYLTQEDLSYEDFVKTIFISLDQASAKYVEDLAIYPGFEDSPEPILKDLNDSTVVMELFHGPTKSFKDYALQPLGAIANRRLNELGERGLVIVATSGDTGSAAIQAVKNSENIDIVVLHPANKVSEYQRKQMTSVVQDNVLNIAVEGSYDDCQRIAKDLLSENPFGRRIISLNSINWLRVMGQVSYYVWLTKQFTSPINVAIPSGNFGNAYSAWFGRSNGLPVNKILCSTNVNDVLRRFIETGELAPEMTLPSVAPSMDIQIPSSLERLIFDFTDGASSFYDTLLKEHKAKLSDENIIKLNHIFSSSTFLDDDIKSEIKSLYEELGSIFDPHSVTSIRMALDNQDPVPTVAVATASPEKFSNVIAPLIKTSSEVVIDEKEEYLKLENDKFVISESIKAYFS